MLFEDVSAVADSNAKLLATLSDFVANNPDNDTSSLTTLLNDNLQETFVNVIADAVPGETWEIIRDNIEGSVTRFTPDAPSCGSVELPASVNTFFIVLLA